VEREPGRRSRRHRLGRAGADRPPDRRRQRRGDGARGPALALPAAADAQGLHPDDGARSA
jgi:hypothetical protein